MQAKFNLVEKYGACCRAGGLLLGCDMIGLVSESMEAPKHPALMPHQLPLVSTSGSSAPLQGKRAKCRSTGAWCAEARLSCTGMLKLRARDDRPKRKLDYDRQAGTNFPARPSQTGTMQALTEY